MNSEYWALAVSLGRTAAPEGVGAAEALANFLWEAGAVGVVENGDDRELALQAFFPPGTDPADLSAGVARYLDELRALALPIRSVAIEARPLPQEAWAEAWRAHFRPVAVGRRLLVCPPWDVPIGSLPGPAGLATGEPSRIPILIEPGRAFGTGGHASTRGCLELLERALAARPVQRALDVGTGSGILAIAAARLGVPDVDAFDVDPDAVAAARANAARNGVASRLRVVIAALPDWPGPPADLVLANLLAPAHVAHAGALGRCTAADGRLIAGGLLAHEVPAVVGALVPEGFRLVEVTEHEGWAALGLAHGA